MNDDVAKEMMPHFRAIIDVATKGDATGRVGERERIRRLIDGVEKEYLSTANDPQTLGAIAKLLETIRVRIG